MKKNKFLKTFTIFTSVMLVLSLAAIIYIYNLLVKYEASQPERAIEKLIDELEKRAFDGTVEELISFEDYKPDSEDRYNKDVSAYIAKLKGELRYEELPTVSSGIAFAIRNGGETLAKVTLESTETKTKLIVFNFEKWEVKNIEPAIIDRTLTLPASIGLSLNGVPIEGAMNPETGEMTYHISSLTTPTIILSDASGSRVPLEGDKKLTTYNYTVSIPSNYTLYVNEKEVDKNVALKTDIPEYQYVYEYFTEMPRQLTYELYLLSNDASFKIFDNLGNETEAKLENRRLTIEGQAGLPSLPKELSAQIDVLNIAKQWSLYMTKDLDGVNYNYGDNGYSIINKMLMDGSNLQTVAKAWANGPDINFVSIHTLGNPPFVNESVTDYVRYGENCFSCSVKFEKHMNIAGGLTHMDPMDSTLYFVNAAEEGEEPLWLLADMRENVEADKEAQ